MDDGAVSLQPVDDERLEYVERLLARNGLPTQDVRAKADCFFVAVQRGERVGTAGLESFPPDGLLRSVVVSESHRGHGLGGRVCDRVEARASTEGIETLYLLTTTAADFFAARGYERVDRADVPVSIRGTSQFEELCPSSAVCLRKSLPDTSDSV